MEGGKKTTLQRYDKSNTTIVKLREKHYGNENTRNQEGQGF